MEETKGHCKHGEFIIRNGCSQCIADREGREGNTEESIAEAVKVANQTAKKIFCTSEEDCQSRKGAYCEGGPPDCAFAEAKPTLVKVQYAEGSPGYTYCSEDRLQVGDVVWVPVKDRMAKGTVIEIDVPASEVEAFKDKVKTIPAGSIVDERKLPSGGLAEAAQEAGADVKVVDLALGEEVPAERVGPGGLGANTYGAQPEPPTEAALALRPGEDVEAHGYYNEAVKLYEYAEMRVINSVEGIKLATNDLSIISKLTKAMTNKRKSLLEPLKFQADAIRETYNYLMAPVIDAEKITKDKMLTYDAEQTRIRQEQEDINRKRMEAAEQEMKLKGELTEPVNLVEVTPEVSKRVSTDLGTAGQRDNWVFEVFDLALLPNEYKVADTAMLNSIAKKHHDQKQIPGVRFINKPIITVRAR